MGKGILAETGGGGQKHWSTRDRLKTTLGRGSYGAVIKQRWGKKEKQFRTKLSWTGRGRKPGEGREEWNHSVGSNRNRERERGERNKEIQKEKLR